ncbi:MAG: hypothetical protein ACOYM3_07770 [Terrimicrobiaceae bacterium]
MRVLLHGFGSFPVLFWHLIRHAQTFDTPPEWAIVLNSDHHAPLFTRLLGESRVLVLNQTGGEPLAGEENWIYPGAIFRDMEAEKRTYKGEPAKAQLERAMGMYRQVRRFASAFRPTHALVSQVEGFDGKVFIAAARELGARIAVPTHCRNLGGIFFSSDDFETLPKYASPGLAENRAAAEKLIAEFRANPTSARGATEILGVQLDGLTPRFAIRLKNALRRWLFTPGGFQWDFLRASFLNNVPFLRDRIWGIRKWKNGRYHDIKAVEDLPERFIFYPLQYSPESSINTPAPYFLDQMRAIDAIRFAMPPDCTLVVKEHPSCILIRPGSFVRKLQKTAGVAVAHFRMPTTEIIRRAGITISITGTATFEAMLLGRQAICLGHNLITPFLGGACPLDKLPARIAEKMGRAFPEEEAVNAIASIFSARYEFNFGSPGVAGEPLLRDKNIEKIYTSFLDHCRREDAAEEPRTDADLHGSEG